MYNGKFIFLTQKFQTWCLSSILSETLDDINQSVRIDDSSAVHVVPSFFSNPIFFFWEFRVREC